MAFDTARLKPEHPFPKPGVGEFRGPDPDRQLIGDGEVVVDGPGNPFHLGVQGDGDVLQDTGSKRFGEPLLQPRIRPVPSAIQRWRSAGWRGGFHVAVEQGFRVAACLGPRAPF